MVHLKNNGLQPEVYRFFPVFFVPGSRGSTGKAAEMEGWKKSSVESRQELRMAMEEAGLCGDKPCTLW